MNEETKATKSGAKVIAKIFSIIMLILFVLLTAANIFYGGQQKLMDKLAMSLARNDYKMFNECVYYDDMYDEQYFNDWRLNIYKALNADEETNIHVKFKFKSRDDFGYMSNGKLLVNVYFEVTYYTDENTYKEDFSSITTFIKGKWYIDDFF